MLGCGFGFGVFDWDFFELGFSVDGVWACGVGPSSFFWGLGLSI